MKFPLVRFSLLLLLAATAVSSAVLNFGPPPVQESAAAEAANPREALFTATRSFRMQRDAGYAGAFCTGPHAAACGVGSFQ